MITPQSFLSVLSAAKIVNRNTIMKHSQQLLSGSVGTSCSNGRARSVVDLMQLLAHVLLLYTLALIHKYCRILGDISHDYIHSLSIICI